MSDQPHPEEEYMHTAAAPTLPRDPDKYRRYLVMAALSARDYDYDHICRVLGTDPDHAGFEKQLGRARREIGLRLRANRKVLDWCRLLPEQAALHRAVRDHTAGIAIFELIDELDDPGLDYPALWDSLCDAADLLMGAGAAGVPAVTEYPDAPVAATLTADAA